MLKTILVLQKKRENAQKNPGNISGANLSCVNQYSENLLAHNICGTASRDTAASSKYKEKSDKRSTNQEEKNTLQKKV